MNLNINYEEMELVVENLAQYFSTGGGAFGRHSQQLKAVDDVSFYIKKGETLGLVGESGSGKTTLGKTILQLNKPTSGKVIFEGQELTILSKKKLRQVRRKMQIIFQDPHSSLNARMSVGSMIAEPMLVHRMGTKNEIEKRVQELLSMVGLRSFHAKRYPHEFSGGQLQRISIARALSVNPNFIVCDEPVSALDVSVQSQILNLLTKLKEELSLTYLFISHDLNVIRHISDKIGVMYLGKIIELGEEKELYEHSLHPYTEALFSVIPVAKPDAKKERIVLKGELPSPLNPPKGCSFHTRCPKAMEICSDQAPVMKEVIPNHYCACHLY